MAASTLKKITTRAKAIRKAHPKTTWLAAVKKAGAEYRSGKKVSGVKKKKVGKAKYKVYHEVKRVGKAPRKKKVGYTTTYGQVIGSVASHISAAKKLIDNKLAKNLLAVSKATTKTKRRKLQKVTAKYKKQLRALSV